MPGRSAGCGSSWSSFRGRGSRGGRRGRNRRLFARPGRSRGRFARASGEHSCRQNSRRQNEIDTTTQMAAEHREAHGEEFGRNGAKMNLVFSENEREASKVSAAFQKKVPLALAARCLGRWVERDSADMKEVSPSETTETGQRYPPVHAKLGPRTSSSAGIECTNAAGDGRRPSANAGRRMRCGVSPLNSNPWSDPLTGPDRRLPPTHGRLLRQRPW